MPAKERAVVFFKVLDDSALLTEDRIASLRDDHFVLLRLRGPWGPGPWDPHRLVVLRPSFVGAQIDALCVGDSQRDATRDASSVGQAERS